jgi:transcription antitermination factor NusG
MAQVKEELLNAVKETQKIMQAIQMELGAIALAELRKEALMAAYKEQQSKVKEASDAIQAEYGDGSVDLESGVFVPTEVPEAEIVE